jgi:hypothetical protein
MTPATILIKIGEWCLTRDRDAKMAVYADHLGCKEMDEAPIEPGDLCWAWNDQKPICFYCEEPVPNEIQALVWLHKKW